LKVREGEVIKRDEGSGGKSLGEGEVEQGDEIQEKVGYGK